MREANDQPMGKHARHAQYDDLPEIPSMPEIPNTPVMTAGMASGASPRSKKPFIIAACIVVGILLVVYIAGAAFFSGHFMPNTTLNDEDLSLQPSETLAQQIQSQADSYSLTVEGEGFSYTFETGSTAVSIDAQQIAADVIEEQGAYTWPIGIFQDHNISNVIVASYDEAGLADTLRAQVEAFNADRTPSVNAAVAYDEASDAFTVQSEVYGNQIDADAIIAKAGECVASMRTDCEVTQSEFIMPAVLGADPRTVQAVESVATLFPNEVSLMLNGTVEAATIDKATFASWLSITPEDYSIAINQDLETAWVNENTSGMDTVGTTRTWTREDGKVCTASGGTWGWAVDTESLATTVYDALVAGGATTIDIPCSQTGDTYNGAGERDWGAYVDVDLSEQQARYYDADGTLLYQCNIISGKPTSSRATPTGIYYLNSKQSPCTLVGYENGQKTYETKVTYWMPFVGNSVGLHDATWQSWSSWSATKYQSSGSHGCVNLSSSDAKWFYQNLSTGVCIITHN